jgi:hypothetical protein
VVVARQAQGKLKQKFFKLFTVLFHREEKVKTLVDDIMEKMPEQFNMLEIQAKVEERTPYVIVCFQVIR